MTDSKEPISLSKFRDAKKTEANHGDQDEEWTPRQCLVDFLAALDRGDIKVNDLMIVYAGERGTSSMGSYDNLATMLGAMDIAKTTMIMDIYTGME